MYLLFFDDFIPFPADTVVCIAKKFNFSSPNSEPDEHARSLKSGDRPRRIRTV
jgi:hypothetical protein